MSPHCSGSRRARALVPLASFLVALLASGASRLAAQDASTPLAPMYGVGQNEFLLGAWINAYQHRLATDDESVTGYAETGYTPWRFLDSLGVTTARVQAEPWIERIVDSLKWWQTRSDQRIILSHLGTGFTQLPGFVSYPETGYSTNIVLYPWNEVDQPSWPSKFTTIDGSIRLDTNSAVLDRPNQITRERILNSTNTTGGQIVATNVVFDWAPRQVNRFKYTVATHDSTVQNTSWPFETYNTRDVFAGSRLWHFVVRLRLPQPRPISEVPADSAVLRLHLYWERRGETTAQHCSCFVVRKADFGDPIPTDGSYYDAVFDADLTHCGTGPGPLNDTSTSRRINLSVEWAGNETVALRSVSIRQAAAQWLMDSASTEGADLNSGMRDHLLRMLYGPSSMILADSLRPVIAMAAGIEHAPAEADGYSAIRQFLSRNFRNPTNPAEYLPPWTEDGDQFALDRVDDSLEVYSIEAGVGGMPWMTDYFGEGVAGVPAAVREHNGGRFHDFWEQWPLIPELELTADSIEQYERSLQRHGFGAHYAPGSMWQPRPLVPSGRATAYTPGVSFLTRLGRTAELARDRNRRLVFVLFNTNAFGFDRHDTGTAPNVVSFLDTIISRIPEAAELRCVANLSLAYSARALIHQISSSAANCLEPIPDPPAGIWTGMNDSWALGPGPEDHQDYFRAFRVYQRGQNGAYAGDWKYTVNRFFTGWGTRYRETQRINRWIRDSIGPQLMKLRWRDGYSINFTVPQNWAVRYSWEKSPGCRGDTCWQVRYDSVGYRPIDTSEIFSAVTARKPGAAADDPAEATYVEMGLFYPRTDSLVVGYDTSLKRPARTHHVFVVNRRCFEPGDETWFAMTDNPEERAADSLLWLRRRDTMTALAETRRISIHLNLPDSGQYRLVRVRELAADVTPLPGTTRPRTPLDTVLYARGTVNITLRPGGGALLKIIELPPAIGLREADLRANSQRKLAFDGRRYHATYHRWNQADTAHRFDSIFYARSYPHADTLGSIHWEPVEYIVSTWMSGPQPMATYANRHPSLTLRTRGADTAVTVVWTAEDNEQHWWRRAVYLRYILSATGTDPAVLAPAPEIVNTYVGSPETEWGTPAVSRLDGGEIIAHADSALGVIARYRTLGSGAQWWQTSGGYSQSATSSRSRSARCPASCRRCHRLHTSMAAIRTSPLSGSSRIPGGLTSSTNVYGGRHRVVADQHAATERAHWRVHAPVDRSDPGSMAGMQRDLHVGGLVSTAGG